jgi:hypothetical protein
LAIILINIRCDVNTLVFVVEAWIGGLVSRVEWTTPEQLWETGEGWHGWTAAGDKVLEGEAHLRFIHEYSVISTPVVDKPQEKSGRQQGPDLGDLAGELSVVR